IEERARLEEVARVSSTTRLIQEKYRRMRHSLGRDEDVECARPLARFVQIEPRSSGAERRRGVRLFGARRRRRGEAQAESEESAEAKRMQMRQGEMLRPKTGSAAPASRAFGAPASACARITRVGGTAGVASAARGGPAASGAPAAFGALSLAGDAAI